ncbi:MAG TPA: type II secretion system protein [Armatimonadetes bacterium]|nr:type II secretion system protein [Armatimonadota bacterium]
MRHSHLRRSGFTLIELLVVIGIIAVLAAIVLPVFSSAQERARQGTCLSNLHALAVAIKIYRQDHRAYPPPTLPTTLTIGSNQVTLNGLSLALRLYPDYVTSLKAMRCPDDNNAEMLTTPQLLTYSTYDAYYNYLGYTVDANGNPLPIQTANVTKISPRWPALYNRNAPDNTIITFCAWHRDFVSNPLEKFDLVVRLGGQADRLRPWAEGGYDYVNQPEIR